MTERFAFLVVGDTQYLFDGVRTNPALLAATFDGVAALQASGAIASVRHVIHVGDVTEHGWPGECAMALEALAHGAARLGKPAMTIATGNHDVAHQSDDTRGPTPFLKTFGPGCALLRGAHLGAPVEHGPGGYSSWRLVSLPDGSTIGVLALNWRSGAEGLDWASRILTCHSTTPTVVVSHDVAKDGTLTPHGLLVQGLLEPQPQVFLVLGGHQWPSTRVTAAGREYHAVNYQQLPFGGAGAARIYEFDPARGECRVISLCPALGLAEVLGSTAARRALALSGAEDQFTFRLPPALGGRPSPWQADGLGLAVEITPDGPVEFETPVAERFVLAVEATLSAAPSRDWRVLLARLGQAPGGSPEPLAALSLSTENFVGWQAFVDGGETWATSHEVALAAHVEVVLSNDPDAAGMWIDGDAVGRVDPHLGRRLVPGPWRWRVGAGEYAGRYCDEFDGVVTRVRFWA